MDKLDGELRQRAARYKGATQGEILSKNELRQVSRMLEPEVASMLFYQSVLESRFDKEFISLVNGTRLETADREFNRKTEVAFVPSAFANSGLKWGADADEVLEGVRALGFQTELIETSPSNSLTENALLIGDYLRNCKAENIILLSRNRGSAEIRMLLDYRGPNAPEFQKLTGWVSVTGILNGSLQLDRLVKNTSNSLTERIFDLGLRIKSKLLNENQTALQQASSSGSLWSNELQLPPSTSLVQIVGVARPRHIPSKKRYLAAHLLKTTGPNDGVLFVEESWIRQGLRYPIWGLHSASNYQAYKNVLERILLIVQQGQKVLSTNKNS